MFHVGSWVSPWHDAYREHVAFQSGGDYGGSRIERVSINRGQMPPLRAVPTDAAPSGSHTLHVASNLSPVASDKGTSESVGCCATVCGGVVVNCCPQSGWICYATHVTQGFQRVSVTGSVGFSGGMSKLVPLKVFTSRIEVQIGTFSARVRLSHVPPPNHIHLTIQPGYLVLSSLPVRQNSLHTENYSPKALRVNRVSAAQE